MSLLTLTSGRSRATLSSFGAQVLSWKVEDTAILYEGSGAKRSGIPLLFPFADPLTDDTLKYTQTELPQHGFGRNVEWEITQPETSKAVATLKSETLAHTWQVAFPYSFQSTLTLALETNGETDSLEYLWHTENTGRSPLPLAPGLHPYFPLDHNRKTTLETQPTLNLTPLQSPAPLQGGLKHPYANLTARFPKFTLTLKADPKPEKLVVWSQPPSAADSNFICLEPFMRDTDGINENPIWLEPGQAWTWKVTFEVILT